MTNSRSEALAGAVSEDAIRHLEIRSRLNRAIYAAVRGYRMGNMADADDSSCAYPLVDLMSNPAPDDIGTGEMEMVALVDEIEAAVAAFTEPAAAMPALATIEQAIRAAKLKANDTHGIAWYNLEEISRVELILAALSAPAVQPGVDPGTPAYEQARAKLVALLREIGAKDSRNGYSVMADRVAAGDAVDIPSWVALQMLAAQPAVQPGGDLVVRRQCSVCQAIVTSYPEGMCCHCHELPWPLVEGAITPDAGRATHVAEHLAIANAVPLGEGVDFEGLGDALFALSARLKASGFLDDTANRPAYERVVAEFQKLTPAARDGGEDD
jgi:hypothetical protein